MSSPGLERQRARVGVDLRWHNDSGVGTVIRNLVNALVRVGSGIDYVFYLQTGQDEFWPPAHPNITVRRIDIPKYSLAEQVALPRMALKDRLDVFHIPFYVIPLCYPGRLVVTMYDLEQVMLDYCMPSRLARLLIRSMMTAAAKRARYILSISDNTKRDLVNVLGIDERKIHTTLLACSPVFLQNFAASAVAACRDRFCAGQRYVLAYTGKQWKLKNTAASIRGFLEAKRRFSLPHKLVIAGKTGAEGEAMMQREMACEYRDSIILTGFVPDEDLALLYRGAEVFIFPSRYEGFGLPPLEAMACGAPVIASSCGSLGEVLGDAALYVDPDRPEQIAEAIGRVASDGDLRERLSVQGRVRARSFSWERAATITTEIYWRAARDIPPSC